jgi:hypothetical protein
VTTDREERRRSRARTSSKEAKKDTQRIVPRGPSGEAGRYPRVDDPDLQDPTTVVKPTLSEIEDTPSAGRSRSPT